MSHGRFTVSQLVHTAV